MQVADRAAQLLDGVPDVLVSGHVDPFRDRALVVPRTMSRGGRSGTLGDSHRGSPRCGPRFVRAPRRVASGWTQSAMLVAAAEDRCHGDVRSGRATRLVSECSAPVTPQAAHFALPSKSLKRLRWR